MGREAQLKPAFSALYPSLTTDRWYTAGAAAGCVKGERIVREGSRVVFRTRIMNSAHFVFRGGAPRTGPWAGLRTRRLDRHPGREAAAG